MSDDKAALLRAKAEEMLRLAEELERAEAGETTDAPADQVESTQEGDAVPPPDEIDPDAPVTGLPEDDEDVSAKRDPLEPMNMRDELEKIRAMLPSRGFTMRGTDVSGEVWEKPYPGGLQGFRFTLTADVHGRINGELRDPRGFVMGNASPAQLIDVEILLQKVR